MNKIQKKAKKYAKSRGYTWKAWGELLADSRWAAENPSGPVNM